MKYLAHFVRSGTVTQHLTVPIDASTGLEALDLATTRLKHHVAAMTAEFPCVTVQGAVLSPSWSNLYLNMGGVPRSEVNKTPAAITLARVYAEEETQTQPQPTGNARFDAAATLAHAVYEALGDGPAVPPPALLTLLDAIQYVAARDALPRLDAGPRHSVIMALAAMALGLVEQGDHAY